ncbi:MAG TPA: S1 RNA-binding domain-containing protein [Amycolatopsis sp.]|uniref:S1 RNA-binding domain-containing protein n=1 Tax=Amycolatopsis sp. TaxID=37632 RepID=UPI002B46653C|nr:S1 RNA-binding domain-containing protein [Amycolatopsis sp.]HKS44500.1 S1 RNA-binding domain-containing protein [Amycolatopsis sp.]
MAHPEVSRAAWAEFLAQHGDGGVLSATVTKVLPFGALLEVAPGIGGLLPRSAWSAQPETGSTISVRIANLDVENRRMSFVAA